MGGMPRKTVRPSIPFLLLALALAEIAGFILVGRAIGVLPTLALILIALVGGLALLRRQSVAALVRIRADLGAGRDPGPQLADAALQALGAVLIALPGFLTSLVGLALFVPRLRASLRGSLSRRFGARVARTGAAHRSGAAVLELEEADYSVIAERDSPWRQNGGGSAQ